MANDQNTVIVIGRITRDIELKTAGQSKVANFSIANNRVYVSNGEKKEETHYFDCEVWGKLAEILHQYGGKGKQLSIEGRLQQKSWEDQEGKKHYKTQIRVNTFQLLGGNPNANGQKNEDVSASSIPDDDTVF